MRRRPSQLQAEAADAALLGSRLDELGLRSVAAIHVHSNRTVLVTLTKKRVLRVHRGFAYAPDRILRAIVQFVSPVSTRGRRKTARRTIVAFPVDRYVAVKPGRRRPERGDGRFVPDLTRLHAELNGEHFEGRLATIPIRVSRRMRTRLGELTVDISTGLPSEIAISLVHIEREGWHEVRHTLLHEMVHQWQVESGLPLDHGKGFRDKARVVGIEPRARRDVRKAEPLLRKVREA